MSLKTDRFINTLSPIAVNEYLSRDKWVLPSVCIAQASLESGWNINAKSLFGIKGTGFKATTTEYYNGNKVIIEDSFRLYPDISSSVVGYFDLICNSKLYQKVVNEPDYKKAVDGLINTGYGYGYATHPNYIKKIISIIEKYDLTRFDVRPSETIKTDSKAVTSDVVQAVIRGEYGNGSERKEKLEKAGYNYSEVQEAVNRYFDTTNSEDDKKVVKPSKPKYKKVTKTIVNAVIRGEYGNGSERKEKLEKAGYNYSEVQEAVNKALS